MLGGTSFTYFKFFRQIIDRNSTHHPFYDYGEEGNLSRYGAPIPPVLNYSNIQTKFAIMAGYEDRLQTPADNQLLIDLIPTDSVIFSKLDYKLDHSGFTLSNMLHHMDDTITILQKYKYSYSISEAKSFLPLY